ncbi:MAG TPA: DNA mismatch repair endonuclease MutL, partial [Humisphaera sp.]
MEDRRRIQQLSPSLVNRIAAGEVIERPANVVKELVENAVDAGATQITVEVEDGGRALVRVIDDGSGIPPADLPLAFASHATSKITCDDDLFRIMTMGFRGEALASIGSVSHARILSRVPGSDTGWEIHNRGGEISSVQAAAANAGTTIEVRNLFFNTPARRKFIKGTATEFGYISDMVMRLALPHPRVAFKLLHNGRATLDLPATDPTERWLAAWPKEFRPERLAIDVRDAELKLHGIVGLPELARPTPKYQYVYLNGRHVRDRFVMHALKEAFRGLTEPGRHPAAVLMLEVPPGDVDVNVHPTKIEVRFKDSGRIHGLVLSGVREKLLGSDLTPAAVPMRSDADDARDDAERQGLREQMAAFFKQQFAPGAVGPAVAQPLLPVAEARVGSPAAEPPRFAAYANAP